MKIYVIVESLMMDAEHHLGYYQNLQDAEDAMEEEIKAFSKLFPYDDSTYHYVKEIEVK